MAPPKQPRKQPMGDDLGVCRRRQDAAATKEREGSGEVGASEEEASGGREQTEEGEEAVGKKRESGE